MKFEFSLVDAHGGTGNQIYIRVQSIECVERGGGHNYILTSGLAKMDISGLSMDQKYAGFPGFGLDFWISVKSELKWLKTYILFKWSHNLGAIIKAKRCSKFIITLFFWLHFFCSMSHQSFKLV